MAMIAHSHINRKILNKMLNITIRTDRNPVEFLITRLFTLTFIITVSLSALPTQPAHAGADAAAGKPAVQEWDVVMDKSRLGFKNAYAGIEFDGRFNKFDARIFFDPANPEAGLFDVNIDVTSVTTFNAERDYAIGDPDWFNFSKFPASTYVTKSIKSAGGNQYVAVGTLDLKGIKKDVELRFTWDEYPNGEVKVAGQARMLAEADILRTDFKVGAGTWEKDDTVAFNVLVKIDLLLQKK